MKIMIAYPPVETEKGVPLLSQNRQFQYFNEPTYIYPMVPASAATLLKKTGYEVIWSDGIAEEKTYSDWLEEVKKESPDLLAGNKNTGGKKTLANYRRYQKHKSSHPNSSHGRPCYCPARRVYGEKQG